MDSVQPFNHGDCGNDNGFGEYVCMVSRDLGIL